MSKLCSNCGASLQDDARFCMKCGAQQPISTQQVSPSHQESSQCCDCCGLTLSSANNSHKTSIEGVSFLLCDDCATHIVQLDQRYFLSTNEKNKELKWASEILSMNRMNPQKRKAFAQFCENPTMKIRGNTISVKDEKQFGAIDVVEIGSPWTAFAKITCFLFVIATLVTGGIIGNKIIYNGAGWFFGALIGLIIGLINVSGTMLLVQIADDIANSKRYIKAIFQFLKQEKSK